MPNTPYRRFIAGPLGRWLDPVMLMRGRIGRLHYMAFLVGAGVASGVIWFSYSWILNSGKPQDALFVGDSGIKGGLLSALLLFDIGGPFLLLFLAISFAARRFHDLGLSGQWNWMLVLLANCPIEVFIVWHAVLLLIPGVRYENRYGPRPGVAVPTPPDGGQTSR